MPGKQAIDAMQTLFDFCESFVVCKNCIFCINPHAEYGDQECFFHQGYSPTFWEDFIERTRGLRDV